MNLLFRTDASVAMGTGHVMRCLALAQAWRDAGGRAVFAMAETTSAIQARLTAESCEVLSLACAAGTQDESRRTIALARERQAGWIVVDGYQFGADYQRALKDAGLEILFLDDYGHAQHYFADMVLNQNVSASESLYQQKEPQTRLLLGPRYALLRREFAAWAGRKRDVSPVGNRVLVMMGGSDAENLTARAIEALALAHLDLETTVVVGGSNPRWATLQDAAARSQQKITVRRDVANIAELMGGADVAVSAAGSTCWELCLMGLPALLIDVADNQNALATELDRKGCAIHLGDRTVSAKTIAAGLQRLYNDYGLRLSLSRRSRELVDGNGSRRVVSLLRGVKGLRLRRVRAEDKRLLWEWANDQEVRASSFSSDPIPWETHVAWFADRFACGDEVDSAGKRGPGKSLMWIAEDGEATPVGQIRFDARLDGDREVDVSIARSMRGRGFGSEVIKLGMQALWEEDPGARVHAFIKPENLASVKAFEQAGFRRIGTEEVRGHTAIHLLCDRK